jgi:AraC-like DNA-binding protein
MSHPNPTSDLTPSRLVMMVMFMCLDELEPEAVLAHAGLPDSLLDDMDGAIPIENVARLLQSAVAVTGDPALGLRVGQEFGMEMLDVVGMLVCNSPNLRTAVTHMSQCMPLISQLTYFELREEGPRTRILMYLPEELAQLESPFIGEFCAAVFFCTARRLIDGNFRICALRSRLPEPAWVDEYVQVVGDDVELVFNADENSVEFDSYLLDLPMKRHSPGLYRQMREQAARRLARQPQPDTTAGSVKHLIEEFLGERLLDLTTIAERMGLTPRTLQRRLKEEATTFQTIYDNCRRERAQGYLRESADSGIETLAAILGYSEPANFYRAFKGWFGVAPNEFRRRYAER